MLPTIYLFPIVKGDASARHSLLSPPLCIRQASKLTVAGVVVFRSTILMSSAQNTAAKNIDSMIKIMDRTIDGHCAAKILDILIHLLPKGVRASSASSTRSSPVLNTLPRIVPGILFGIDPALCAMLAGLESVCLHASVGKEYPE